MQLPDALYIVFIQLLRSLACLQRVIGFCGSLGGLRRSFSVASERSYVLSHPKDPLKGIPWRTVIEPLNRPSLRVLKELLGGRLKGVGASEPCGLESAEPHPKGPCAPVACLSVYIDYYTPVCTYLPI